MLLFQRFLRRSTILLCAATGVCAAQPSQSSNQFQNVAQVQPTGGRVTSFVTGTFQSPPQGSDILYVNAPVANRNPLSGVIMPPSVTAGELLNQGGAGFANLTENQVTFADVSNVVAASSNFAGFGVVGYAFALTPAGTVTTNLCIYAGTGAHPPSVGQQGQGSSYDLGLTPNKNNYPPTGGKSGCTTFATLATNSPPVFGTIVPMPFRANLAPQLLVEDTANGIVYVLTNDGTGGGGGLIPGVKMVNALTLAPGDGAGPMYTADLNRDGNIDLIVNNQTGLAATVYLGNGDGTFRAPIRVTFGEHIHSLLLQDMDGDGIPDLIAEVDGGIIEIHKGNGDGTFQSGSIGGTIQDTNNGLEGNGGHLVGFANLNGAEDLVTTTPIGLSVLLNQGGNQFKLTNIYNIGSGRSSYALGDFYGTGNVDLAVDSAEGVAIISGNGDGTFQTSLSYAALAPGLSAVAGRFRNFANNPNGVQDVVVGTGLTQAQWMRNDGTGKFSTYPAVANSGGTPSGVPAKFWSTLLTGDFDGDGNLDLVYSYLGLPLPASGLGIAVQYGNGDGTFGPAGASVSGNIIQYFYGETVVGDFTGDGLADLANNNSYIVDTIVGLPSKTLRDGTFAYGKANSTPFDQIAAGFFKTGRSTYPDIVFQDGPGFFSYKNQDTQTPSFVQTPIFTSAAPPLYASTVLLTDMDGDGNADLVVVYFNSAGAPAGSGAVADGRVDIWYGKGDGTFAATPLTLTLSRNYYLGAVADMNADGLPDLVLSDGSLVSILYNQGGRNFGTLQSNGLYTGEQHFLAGQGINSILLADVNGDGTPDLIAANGGITISNPIALGGKTASTIALTPNSDVNTGGITVLLNHITTSPVTEKLVATPEPSPFQGAFTLTATITPSAGVALPTGAVQFSLDGNLLGAPIAVMQGTGSSTATYTVPAGNTYTAGPHTVAANYLGDTANSPMTVTATHQIQTGAATTTTLFLCIGGTTACPSNGTVAAPAPPYPTMLSMYFGQSYNGVLSTAANDGSTLNPTSAINFTDDYNGVTTTLCTLVLGPGAGGTCLPPVGAPGTTSTGINVFTGVYPGDATHTGSSSIPATINVAPDTTTAKLTGAPNPSPQGQPITLTATVTGNYAAPAGPVVFSYGSIVLGTAPLVAGGGLSSTATLTTTALPFGTDVVTANYAATLNFNAASATVSETITASLGGSFTVTVTPTPVTVGVGYSTLLVVTVTPQNGFAQGVNLTCANLPSEASCFFDDAAIAAGGGTTNLVVGTTAPHTCGTAAPYFLGSNSGGPWPLGLGALAGVALLFLPGKRRWLRSLIAMAVMAAVMQMTGCGTCTDLGTRPATYTFQVVGTATGSGAAQAQNVTMTVTI